jgi:phosphoserine phosphatase
MHGIDELTSWRKTPTLQAIVEFVDAVTREGSDTWLSPAERIAVFDNDGTLWPEKPMDVQLDFALGRFAALAEATPSLRERQPYKAAWSGDGSWLQEAILKHYNGDSADVAILLHEVPAAFAGMTIEAYLEEAAAFVAESAHARFGVPYIDLAYVPMLELLRFLDANGFTIYIVSGGERDFMRAFAERMYNVPPERIIGSSLKLSFEEEEDSVRIVYRPEMNVFDDGEEKPKNIWSRIGRRPVIAGGNSNGDIAMLRFANAPGRPSLRLLVRHDDPEREYADDGGAEAALERARQRGWTVISMRSDWSRVFAHDPVV